MRILIAPNAFKNSLNAFDASKCIELGLQRSLLDCDTEIVPLADGGDDTLDILLRILGGQRQEAVVQDPLGRNIKCQYGINGEQAFIEMASASGLRLMDSGEYDPLRASTFGTGQLIMQAIRQGAREIVIGIGGSGTVDGGTGMLAAMGAKFYDNNGNEISNDNPLIILDRIDFHKVVENCKGIKFTILCDVENPLLGPTGAAHIFGPQKGATESDVIALEQAMMKFSEIVSDWNGTDHSKTEGSGAAGGLGFALLTVLNGQMVGGAGYIIEASNFKEKLLKSDLVITGEGKLDSQSVGGKAPFMVAKLANELGKPCIALAGKIEDHEQLYDFFTSMFPIVNGPISLDEAISNANQNMIIAAQQLGNTLSINRD